MAILPEPKKEPTPLESMALKWMNLSFDFVVIVLALLTMAYVVYAICDLVGIMFHGFDVEGALHEFLLVIILLELFELLTLYIKEHHVSMRRVAELGVVALVRKLVITVDYKSLGWEVMLGMAALIFVLGWIYVQERRRVSEEEKFIVEHGLNR
ncbi:phosphate-starvation-inducible PsiE family protein [Thermococcus waiotapuensis]|uniref:Phosphate-starvation-inducible PsiE family protein n=1 Tax=Thermococcus waiotapuensis TaxID=90909 RepID=A0AAE4NVD5_9EURY|nr:phosphate-starvation-inducible PsiE family protein [Thermococcus waiotapuensis]MDV3103336.1 phosphate-starvation-inducible PsiE family protein [Thermococcus waiotapuensis]